jgi:hypothetical protein
MPSRSVSSSSCSIGRDTPFASRQNVHVTSPLQAAHTIDWKEMHPVSLRCVFRVCLRAFGIAAIGACTLFGAAQTEPVRDYQREATFLYELVNFVDWPQDVGTASDPLRLVIVGADPFDGLLDRLVAANNPRHVVIVRSASRAKAPQGHVVFIAASEEQRLTTVLGAYCRVPVLTVSDINRFAERGGVIGLVMQDQNVRLAINRTAAEEAGLRISSQVLHLAVPLFSATSPCH